MDQPLKQWLTGEKEGKTKIQNLEYIEKEKSLLDEIKIFFEWLSFGEKLKFDKKIADTSFKNIISIDDLAVL